MNFIVWPLKFLSNLFSVRDSNKYCSKQQQKIIEHQKKKQEEIFREFFQYHLVDHLNIFKMFFFVSIRDSKLFLGFNVIDLKTNFQNS